MYWQEIEMISKLFGLILVILFTGITTTMAHFPGKMNKEEYEIWKSQHASN